MKNARAKFRQISNIWAMLSAAGFAAAFFQGQWFWGLLFGLFSLIMSLKLIDAAEAAKEDDE